MMELCIEAFSDQVHFIYISFQWNTDAVPLFCSSSYSMWPLYVKIIELPFTLYNCINNKILAGVWFDDKKPSINKFLKHLHELSILQWSYCATSRDV